jgi:hypothetical protein
MRNSLLRWDLSTAISTGIGVLLGAYLVSLSAPLSAESPQKTLISITVSSEDSAVTSKVEAVDFDKVARITPSYHETEYKRRKHLLEEREISSDRLIGSDGKRESDEAYQNRIHAFPEFRYDRGPGVYYQPGVGFPPGAISISSTCPIFGLDGRSTREKKTVWRWDVPVKYQKASIKLPYIGTALLSEQFKPILLETKDKELLLLFDASHGLVWQKNIQELIPCSEGLEKGDNPYSVVGIACSFDGAFTLVAISPHNITADAGGRLLVFNHKGRLISQQEMPGASIFYMARNGSGRSYVLSTPREFEDGKRVVGNPLSQLLYLRKDGQIAGVFTREDGRYISALKISDDDAIAVSEGSGSVFMLP